MLLLPCVWDLYAYDIYCRKQPIRICDIPSCLYFEGSHSQRMEYVVCWSTWRIEAVLVTIYCKPCHVGSNYTYLHVPIHTACLPVWCIQGSFCLPRQTYNLGEPLKRVINHRHRWVDNWVLCKSLIPWSRFKAASTIFYIVWCIQYMHNVCIPIVGLQDQRSGPLALSGLHHMLLYAHPCIHTHAHTYIYIHIRCIHAVHTYV